MIKFIKRHVLRINIIVVITLLLIHFVIKESNYFFSLFYYAFPLPIIIMAVLFFSFFVKNKPRIYNFILALILLVIWFSKSFKINTSETIEENDIEIVFWNATHKRELSDVFEKNKNSIPDVVVLVEYHANELDEDKIKYDNCFFYWHEESEIGVFSKNQIEIKNIITSEDKSVIINFVTNNLNFYAVDVEANMNVFRKKQLSFITDLVKTSKSSIILGDFNTPIESKFLSDIKKNFNHVLNEKGNGFRETWFWNMPFLSLDHIWVSKDLQILNAKKINTFKSDHTMVKTVIRK